MKRPYIASDLEVIARELDKYRAHVEDPVPAWEQARAATVLHVGYALEASPFYRGRPQYLALQEQHGRAREPEPGLPVTTRRDAVDAGLDMYSDGIPFMEVYRRTTSGTSGEALTVLVERSALLADLAVVAAILPEAAQRLPVVIVADIATWPEWSGTIPLPGLPHVVSVRAEGKSSLPRLAGMACRALLGTPTALAAVVARLRERALALPQTELVITSGEVLTDEVRDQLTSGLRAPVMSAYALAEAGIVGTECRIARGFHFDPSRVLVEEWHWPHATESGDVTEILVTPLRNRAMPLLRYQTGDIGRVAHDPCACGSALPRIVELAGRRFQYFRTADGRWVNPEPLSVPFARAGLRQYQLIQHDPGGFEIWWVRGDGDPDFQAVRNAVARLMGAAVVLATRQFATGLPLDRPTSRFATRLAG